MAKVILQTQEHQVLVRRQSNWNYYALLMGVQHDMTTAERLAVSSTVKKYSYHITQQSHSLLFTQMK